ncbi:MAG: hypothetical protein U0L47_08180 [Paludibacteraceae bacterium]|jgi:hypothetical protein|nr:hypothetical protein [Paludibacteraceae bacterium]
MKKTSKIFALAALVVAFASCEKHDFFDKNTITGAVGPEAYWEVESSAVKAGGQMGFTTQYYSAVEEIDHSEVWYSLSQTVDKVVTCSWLTYSETSSIKTKQRELQQIADYPHLQEYWNDSLHAYTFAGTFPVSGTLSPIAWVQPAEFDADRMVNYFGKDYMENFKAAVKKKMSFEVYRKRYPELGFMEDFKLYTDSSYDWNISPDSAVAKYYHFPLDEQGNVQPWVMDSMNYYWDMVTFEQLILNAEGNYDVSYKRNYSIDAELHVVDVKGTYSKTISKEIVVN